MNIENKLFSQTHFQSAYCALPFILSCCHYGDVFCCMFPDIFTTHRYGEFKRCPCLTLSLYFLHVSRMSHCAWHLSTSLFFCALYKFFIYFFNIRLKNLTCMLFWWGGWFIILQPNTFYKIWN